MTGGTVSEAPSDVLPGESSTRDRILDIAIGLFTAQGYDKTSIRQIAERLGYSKAAIYYHFASKEDILRALHMRLHDFGREALSTISEADASPETWAALLDQLIDQMLENRALFILHERNQAAFEELHHNEQHDAAHQDLQALFREMLANKGIALESRVRMACAFGAVMGGLVLAGNVFADVSSDDLGTMIRRAVSELLRADTAPH
jgi:AcrR family transcriptional regulator